MLSPTTAEALLACPTRLAFMSDDSFVHLRRLSPAAALGLLSHETLERATRGDFSRVAPEELRGVISETWEESAERLHRQMSTEALIDSAPRPRRWPNYALTRARVIGFIERRAREQAPSAEDPSPTAAEAEVWIESSNLRLRGQIDRVERGTSGTRIIDLKSSRDYGDKIKEPPPSSAANLLGAVEGGSRRVAHGRCHPACHR